MTYLTVLFIEFKLISQMVRSNKYQLITSLLAQASLFLFALDDGRLECEAELIRGIMSIYYL